MARVTALAVLPKRHARRRPSRHVRYLDGRIWEIALRDSPGHSCLKHLQIAILLRAQARGIRIRTRRNEETGRLLVQAFPTLDPRAPLGPRRPVPGSHGWWQRSAVEGLSLQALLGALQTVVPGLSEAQFGLALQRATERQEQAAQ